MRLRQSTRPASVSRGRPYMLTVGALGLGLVVLMLAIAFNAPNSIPGRSYYNLEAAFTDGDNLTPHSQVRLGGKLVGQVLDPRSENGVAVIDLQIDPEYGPLKADSSVEIRPRSPVGVRYVEIEPGTSGRELKDGERIPKEQTSATTPLDEVLATFDEPTKAGTQDFLQGFGGGLLGRGDDLNESFQIAPRMLQDTQSVLGAVNARVGATEGLVSGAANAATAADPARVELGEGFDPQARALRPLADREASLHSTLEEAPPTLDTVTSRLPAVDGMLSELRGFTSALRPGLQAAPATFTQVDAMFREAPASLRDADDVLRLAGDAVDPTLELLDTTRPVLPRLESGLRDAAPTLVRFGRHRCDLMAWPRNWSDMLSRGNDAGGQLRFLVVAPSAETFLGANEGLEGNALLAANENPYPEPCTAGTLGLDGTPE